MYKRQGQLQLSWNQAPTRPVTVTVEATSILDNTDKASLSFLVQPALADSGADTSLNRLLLGPSAVGGVHSLVS